MPLERIDVVRLLVEEPLFEGADVSSALLGLHRATLADVEVVEHGIGVAARSRMCQLAPTVGG
jgi:hypothetical protein